MAALWGYKGRSSFVENPHSARGVGAATYAKAVKEDKVFVLYLKIICSCLNIIKKRIPEEVQKKSKQLKTHHDFLA